MRGHETRRRFGRLLRDLRDTSGAESARATPPDSSVRSVQAQVKTAQQDLEMLKAEHAELRAERLRLQEALGALHGKRVLPRLRVEKTNGVPSFVAGVRLMQRIHRRAENPSDGLDGAGAVFADPERTEAFVRSHGVPFDTVRADEATPSSVRQVVVHAFKGEVGLVEVRDGDLVRHFDEAQVDPGDIRAGVAYGSDIAAPTAFEDLCAWSSTLSRRIPRPYVQVCWLDVGSTVALDTIDVDPDRIPVLTPEWDKRLGTLFDRAHARMLLQPYSAGALDNRVPGGTFDPEDTP